MASKSLVTTSENLPSYLKNVADDNRGSENVTKEDLVIPRLGLVQSLSPERKKTEPEYIEGAEEGNLFNTVTRQIYGDSVLVVPVYFEKLWLLWKDRKQGGGFGGQYKTQDEAEEALSAMENPESWEIIGTPTHICLVVDGDNVSEIMIPMPKSKAKVSRQWNSTIRFFGGPRFMRVYEIKGIPDQNNAGDDFHNFAVKFSGFPSEALFKRAEKFYEDIVSGKLSYQMDQEEAGLEEKEGKKPNF